MCYLDLNWFILEKWYLFYIWKLNCVIFNKYRRINILILKIKNKLIGERINLIMDIKEKWLIIKINVYICKC